MFTYIYDIAEKFEIFKKILKKNGYLLIHVHQFKFSSTFRKTDKIISQTVANQFSNQSLINIFNFHKGKKNILTIVGSLRHFEIPYGICKLNSSGSLREILEKPSYDYLVNTGVYIFEPTVLKYIKKENKMDINDLIEILTKNKRKIGVYPLSSDSWFDFGQWNEVNKNISYLNKF